jgi:hypothetical protein
VLLFSSPCGGASEAIFRFDARKALILKMYLDAQLPTEPGRKVSRMPRRWTLRSIHIDWQSNYKAFY